MGLAGYYRKYIDSFTQIACPIFELMKTRDVGRNGRKANGQTNNKKVPIEWNESVIGAIYKQKDAVCGPYVLILPDFNEKFFLATDACNYAYGAVLAQMIDQELRPDAYYSKNMRSKKIFHVRKRAISNRYVNQTFSDIPVSKVILHLYGLHATSMDTE